MDSAADADAILHKIFGFGWIVQVAVTSISLSTSAPIWNNLKGLPDLRQAPYPPELFLAQKTSLFTGIVCLVWHFVAFIPVVCIYPWHRKIGYLVWALPNLGLAVSFAAALTGQSHYIPGNCKNATEWKFKDVAPSIFSAMASHANSTPTTICGKFLSLKRAQITLTVGLSIWVLPLIFVLLLVMLLFVWVILISFIGFTLPPFRFAFGFIRKFFQRQPKPMNRISSTDDCIEKGPPRVGNDILERHFKSVWDGVLDTSNIDDIHFADILRLSHTSHSLRRMIESAGDASTEKLRQTTCIMETKVDCWGCKGQICAGCTFTRQIRDPSTTAHLEDCNNICSRCWWVHMYHRSNRFEEDKEKVCSHRYPALKDAVERDLCSTCYMNGNEEAPREMRAQVEMKELRKTESRTPYCALCQERLHRFMPRWWICMACGTWCSSHLHSSWVSGAKKQQ